MKVIFKIFQYLEKGDASNIQLWIFSVLGIIAVRDFLETLSSSKLSGHIDSYTALLLHWPLFYLPVLLGFILLFYFSSKPENRNIIEISKVFGFGLIAIWIAPTIDLILSGGSVITYIGEKGENFFSSLFYLIPFWGSGSVTLGIKIELFIIFTSIALYFYYKNRSVIKTFQNFILNYLFGFWMATIPTFLLALSNLFSSGSISLSGSLESYVYSSQLTSFRDVFSAPLVSFSNGLPQANQVLYTNLIAWDIVLAWFFFILAIAFLNIWFYLVDKNKFIAFWKNVRWERSIYWVGLIFVGFFISYKLGFFYWNWSFLNLLNLTVLIIVILASWFLSVGINDIKDQKIDAISNKERPLIKQTLSVQDVKNQNFILVFIIFIALFLLKFEVALLILVVNACAFLYSEQPFRFKRLPIFSNVFTGLSSVLVISTGFSLSSGGQWVAHFPTGLIFILLFCFTLISLVKDIKDIEGDAADGIKTIPVVFGAAVGKIIISVCVFVATLIISFMVQSIIFTTISLVFSLIAAWLINKENFKERPLFLLLFIYAILLFIVIF